MENLSPSSARLETTDPSEPAGGSTDETLAFLRDLHLTHCEPFSSFQPARRIQ